MIFVTVGTHEQPFNRLVEYIDNLKRDGTITEKVIIQTGYSTYEPQYCKWKKLFPYQEILKMVGEARIVITHGGPSSFVMPLQIGKIPVVVPRQKQFNEHVNDHQLYFAKQVAKRQKNIIVIEKIDNLGTVLLKYDRIIETMKDSLNSNNALFIKKFELIVDKIIRE